jgi:hypothetical protein
MTDLYTCKELFGKYFFGVDEIINIFNNIKMVDIPYDIDFLKKYSDTHILILGTEITIKDMIDIFGMNPKYEPCFYNQDWFLKEDFINKKLENKWYLLKRDLIPESRGKLSSNNNLPSAVLTTYTFFINYFINSEILWKNEFIWCSDVDHNGDQIYTGRYLDIDQMNNNGFNIHRHLKIKNNFGEINQL